jgi:hypothetical protein
LLESVQVSEKISIQDCRDEVKQFACLMEQKLREHDGIRTWKDANQGYLYQRLTDEIQELHLSLFPIPFQFEYGPRQKEEILKECADVANFAMMIWDVSK